MSFTDSGIGQRLAALGLLDVVGLREQRVEVAIFIDELRGGLHADALGARHIVGRVAGERLHVDDPVGRHAEIVDDLGLGDEPLLARAFRAGDAGRRVIHRHAGADELHQILVGGDDEHIGAALARLRRRRWR